MADFPHMTDKAAAAFADYIGMGPGRSLASLCNRYQKSTKAPPTKRLETLKEWSTKYQWQARISSAVTEAVTRKLELAAELDADTFFKTSQRLNETVSSPGFIGPGDITRIRESVRKPEPKGSTSVSVNLDIQISQAIERIADAEGMTDAEREEFERDVKMHLEKVRA